MKECRALIPVKSDLSPELRAKLIKDARKKALHDLYERYLSAALNHTTSEEIEQFLRFLYKLRNE